MRGPDLQEKGEKGEKVKKKWHNVTGCAFRVFRDNRNVGNIVLGSVLDETLRPSYSNIVMISICNTQMVL